MPEEIEPNDSIKNATLINDAASVKGYINNENDIDFFKLEISKPVIADILLSAVKGINHAINIWAIENNSPKLIKVIDDLRKSSPERICNFFFKKGIYYISISHGEKDIHKSNLENPYNLQLTYREPGNFEEKESNDSPESANPITFNQDFSGYFSPSYNRLNIDKEGGFREEDWFYFDITLSNNNPILITVELSGVIGINSTLYLYEQNKTEIGSSDINSSGGKEIINRIGIKTSGRYYIMLTSKNFESNSDMPYSLRLQKQDYEASEEMEPNNSFENANIIENDSINGKIFPKDDNDIFKIKSSDDKDIYRIEAESPLSLDLQIKIFDENKKFLFEIDNSPKGEKEIFPNVYLKNDFYIEINSRSNYYNEEDFYSLKLLGKSRSEDDELEPNDSKDTATRINEGFITGYTSFKNDKDYYFLEYPKRIKNKFTVTAPKKSEIKVSITGPLGYIIKSIKVKNSRSKEFSEMIDLKGYLIVESIISNYNEPYIIEISEAQ